MRSFLLRLAYGNFWLAASASGLAAVSLSACRLPWDSAALGLPSLAVFVVYTLDKVAKWEPADGENDPERSAFIGRWRLLLLVLGGSALLLGAAWAYARSFATLFWFVVPFPIALAYGTPVLPSRFRYRRLKDITGGKSLTVAVTWSAMCVSLPVAAVGGETSAGYLILFAWVFLRFFVNTVFFDIGDVAGDAKEGVITLPVWLGVSRTVRYLELVTFLALAVGVGLVWMTPTAPVIAAIAFGFLYDLAYLRAFRTTKDLGFLCDVVVDGLGIATGLVVVVTHLVAHFVAQLSA